MGQYFIPVNVTKKEALTRNTIIPGVEWFEVIGGLKMMETAYTMNSQVMCVLAKMQNEWFGDSVVWAGDYEDSDSLEFEERLYSLAGGEHSSYRDVTADTLGYAPWYQAEKLFEVGHYGKYELPQTAFRA
ncbi:MAG: hypothetical protein LBN43_05375 [Oscillospiraceae bacterium]|jgi:hypothetical protein|nr:hypothetical protein [Oscillospiraceae bacterium]